MEKTKSFQDVNVWKKAHDFVLNVYKLTETFPRSEIFALSSQFRRAAISIPANIAEGYKKNGIKDKIRYYNIAQGSLEECKYYLILSEDLKYIQQGSNYLGNVEEIGKMLESYIQGLKKKIVNSSLFCFSTIY